MSQAYTLVANYATGAQGKFGQSALYSLVPEVGFYPPRLAPANQNIAYLVNFGTHQNLPLWTSQSDKVIERRWDQALPLTLAPDSTCFQEWQTNSTSPIVCKSHTGIRPEGRQGRQTLDAADDHRPGDPCNAALMGAPTASFQLRIKRSWRSLTPAAAGRIS
jgi:hypothetical protein